MQVWSLTPETKNSWWQKGLHPQHTDAREPAWETETQEKSKERNDEEESEISSMAKNTIEMLETVSLLDNYESWLDVDGIAGR